MAALLSTIKRKMMTEFSEILSPKCFKMYFPFGIYIYIHTHTPAEFPHHWLIPGCKDFCRSDIQQQTDRVHAHHPVHIPNSFSISSLPIVIKSHVLLYSRGSDVKTSHIFLQLKSKERQHSWWVTAPLNVWWLWCSGVKQYRIDWF